MRRACSLFALLLGLLSIPEALGEEAGFEAERHTCSLGVVLGQGGIIGMEQRFRVGGGSFVDLSLVWWQSLVIHDEHRKLMGLGVGVVPTAGLLLYRPHMGHSRYHWRGVAVRGGVQLGMTAPTDEAGAERIPPSLVLPLASVAYHQESFRISAEQKRSFSWEIGLMGRTGIGLPEELSVTFPSPVLLWWAVGWHGAREG
ncbi:MAG: hypothetical protein ABIO70_27510 [Pseudomonadota bacterium]